MKPMCHQQGHSPVSLLESKDESNRQQAVIVTDSVTYFLGKKKKENTEVWTVICTWILRAKRKPKSFAHISRTLIIVPLWEGD